jgi:hypothetical protein
MTDTDPIADSEETKQKQLEKKVKERLEQAKIEKLAQIKYWTPGYVKLDNLSYLNEEDVTKLFNKLAEEAAIAYDDPTLTSFSMIVNIVGKSSTNKLFGLGYVFIKEVQPGNRFFNILTDSEFIGKRPDGTELVLGEGKKRPKLGIGKLSPEQVKLYHEALSIEYAKNRDDEFYIEKTHAYEDYKLIRNLIAAEKKGDEEGINAVFSDFDYNYKSRTHPNSDPVILERLDEIFDSEITSEDILYVKEALNASANKIYKTRIAKKQVFVQNVTAGMSSNHIITNPLASYVTVEQLRLFFVHFSTSKGSYSEDYNGKKIDGPYPHVYIERNQRTGDNIGHIVFEPGSEQLDARYALHMRRKFTTKTPIKFDDDGNPILYGSHQVVLRFMSNKPYRGGKNRSTHYKGDRASTSSSNVTFKTTKGKTFSTLPRLKQSKTEEKEGDMNPFASLKPSDGTPAVSAWSKPIPEAMLEPSNEIFTQEEEEEEEAPRGYDPDLRDDGNLPFGRFF